MAAAARITVRTGALPIRIMESAPVMRERFTIGRSFILSVTLPAASRRRNSMTALVKKNREIFAIPFSSPNNTRKEFTMPLLMENSPAIRA